MIGPAMVFLIALVKKDVLSGVSDREVSGMRFNAPTPSLFFRAMLLVFKRLMQPVSLKSTPKIGLSCSLLPDDPHGVLRCFNPAAFLFWQPGIVPLC
jgi:hypothetical protein